MCYFIFILFYLFTYLFYFLTKKRLVSGNLGIAPPYLVINNGYMKYYDILSLVDHEFIYLFIYFLVVFCFVF